MRKWIARLIIFGTIGVLMLSGCGRKVQTAAGEGQFGMETEKNEAADAGTNSNWLITVTDTKQFPYAIPSGNVGTIDMTATLYFIAWKNGGEEAFGQYEGWALTTFDMDLGKAGGGGVSYSGGVMEDMISDHITFELLKAEENAVKIEGEDIDLAPLAQFIGQAEILTDEYTVSLQNWKAMADGEVKLEVDGSFGDGEKLPQGYTLRVGEDTVLMSVGDLKAAYGLDDFTGTIEMVDTQTDIFAWIQDVVEKRMEERLSFSQQTSEEQAHSEGFGTSAQQSGLTVDSQGREGMDTNGDGRLEIYFGKDGEVWQDFDGDGKYEITGSEGSSDMD